MRQTINEGRFQSIPNTESVVDKSVFYSAHWALWNTRRDCVVLQRIGPGTQSLLLVEKERFVFWAFSHEIAKVCLLTANPTRLVGRLDRSFLQPTSTNSGSTLKNAISPFGAWWLMLSVQSRSSISVIAARMNVQGYWASTGQRSGSGASTADQDFVQVRFRVRMTFITASWTVGLSATRLGLSACEYIAWKREFWAWYQSLFRSVPLLLRGKALWKMGFHRTVEQKLMQFSGTRNFHLRDEIKCSKSRSCLTNVDRKLYLISVKPFGRAEKECTRLKPHDVQDKVALMAANIIRIIYGSKYHSYYLDQRFLSACESCNPQSEHCHNNRSDKRLFLQVPRT